jgi:serine/threonine protein phosphatase 1
MKKTIFAISDIHGHYDEMIKTLNEVGYNEGNENHLLVVLGDCFDRGRQSLDIYKYLKRLTDEKKAVVIVGNHDIMLEEYLNGVSIRPFNYIHNGTNETLGDFLHQTCPFEMWCVFNNIDNPTMENFATWLESARKEINDEYPELLPWLKSLPYYYETKYHIFTHGAIDTERDDWQNTSHWYDLTWDDGSFFGKEIKNTDKDIVIGHFSTLHLRELYGLDFEKDPNEILIRDDGKVVALDACTILSKKINVLIVEDEELLNENKL